jgi:multicomponent K+:H+ antiporter subunit D
MADKPAPVRILEIAPVMLLIVLTVVMTVMAGPIMNYMTATAAELHAPAGYIADVLQTPLAAPLEEIAP